MPQQMDDELLQQAQAGEESAIAALITAMMPAIRKGAAPQLAEQCHIIGMICVHIGTRLRKQALFIFADAVF